VVEQIAGVQMALHDGRDLAASRELDRSRRCGMVIRDVDNLDAREVGVISFGTPAIFLRCRPGWGE